MAASGTFDEVVEQYHPSNEINVDTLKPETIPEGDQPTTCNPLAMGQENEPFVGQEFDSQDAAIAFYKGYAFREGFTVRASNLTRSRTDGAPNRQILVCSKEGFREPNKREKILRLRVQTRIGCLAMILINKVNPSGKWVVRRFVKEHNHPLTSGTNQKECICDQNQFYDLYQRVQELTQQLEKEKAKSATYKRHLNELLEKIDEQDERMSKRIEDVVDIVKEVED